MTPRSPRKSHGHCRRAGSISGIASLTAEKQAVEIVKPMDRTMLNDTHVRAPLGSAQFAAVYGPPDADVLRPMLGARAPFAGS